MSVFNLSSIFRGGGGGASQTYNTLVDQLSIMENHLETDGKLSPGDYDLLLSTAQKFHNAPGLNAGQRSNIAVKISQYQKGKGNVTIKDSGDTENLDTELKDTLVENVRALGNNPQAFAQANHDASLAKVARLSDMLDSLDNAGSDSTKVRMEYLNALNDLTDARQVLQDMSVYKPGSAPTSKRIAYVDTNDKGEITNVKFGRPGEQSKYVPTNGVYGGLQIYGRPNGVENGNKVFKLGDTTFDAPDILEPDPENPLAMRVRPLMAKDTQTRGGKVDIGKINIYKDLGAQNMQVQSLVPANGWAMGSKGVLYQRQSNGQYTKYLNADPEALGIAPNNIIKLPKSFESTITPNVTQTIDPSLINLSAPSFPGGSAPTSSLAIPGGPTPPPVGGFPTTQTTSPNNVPSGTPRTPAPTERAPGNALGVASRAYQGAKNFLSGLFR